MAKNTKQIALIQNRHGKLNELPKQLSTSELGFADDENRLFIGNPENPILKERYESNTFPYGNVEILTEFSELTTQIKYSPWMNGKKIHYPITVLGNVENPVVPVGSSIIINDQEIEFTNQGVVVSDYDYLVLRYIWTDGDDLDTDTRFTNLNNFPEINDVGLGFGPIHQDASDQNPDIYGGTYQLPLNSSVTSSYLFSVGDNTGTATPEHPQEENILISRYNIINDENMDLLPDNINIKLSGTWYASVGHNIVKIQIYAYKGGVMIKNDSTYRFYNEGGEQLNFIDDYGNTVDHLEIEVNNISDVKHHYTTFGYININKYSGATSISTLEDENNSSSTNSNKQKTINLLLAAKQINDSGVNVDASVVNNRLQLKTIAEELILDNGTQVEGYPPILDIFGFDETSIVAVSPTKRTLQDVLDDRYSIKSFDVKGDGVFNDAHQINTALEILYDYNKSDPKELYFPADKYLVNNESLLLYTNTHLVGEGIDRTFIRSNLNTNPLITFNGPKLVLNVNGEEELEYPHNILIEDMTFDIFSGSISDLIMFSTCSDVTFRNCKFICNKNGRIVNTLDDAILKNIKFEDCIFEGKDTSEVMLSFKNELNGLLITNCEFKDCKNNVIKFDGYHEDGNFTDEYGNFESAKFAVTLTEDMRDWLYSGCVNLNKGTLGILIDRNLNLLENNFTIENFKDSSLNSMYYVPRQNKWYLTIASDQNAGMEWSLCSTQGGHGLYLLDYAHADLYNNWNDNKKDSRGQHTVISYHITSEISRNGKLLTIYKEGNEICELKQIINHQIENVIIANNKFSNCSSESRNLIKANEQTRYISIVKSLVDQDVLMKEDGYEFFITLSDLNYCDTPDISTDTNKFLRFNFYQDVYDYVQDLYNKFGKKAFEVVSPDTDVTVTNYLRLIQGINSSDNEKDNTLSINATSQTGDVEINMGQFGDLHLGKNSGLVEEWKENYPYNIMDMVIYNEQGYRCIEEHTSSELFDSSKWVSVSSDEISLWTPNANYVGNDLVIYNDKVYKCILSHTSDISFNSENWIEIADADDAIVLHKNLDLNSNAIENKNGDDVIIKLNNNAILVDDSLSDTSYSERIGNKGDALATVNYVNETINSNIRKKYNVESINKQVSDEKSSELTLVNFDSAQYGNNVYLKDISLNVRQLYIPIAEQIVGLHPDVCKYLDWTNKIPTGEPNYYDKDDVVEVYNPTDGSYGYYKCIVSHEAVTSQANEYDNFMVEFSNGYWSELTTGQLYYEGYSSQGFEYVDWYKGDVVRTLVNVVNNRTFPEEYGVVESAKFAATLTEDKTDWLYSGCITFTNGTLGILIDKELNILEDKFVWETFKNSALNSMFYIPAQNKWYLSIATDSNASGDWSLYNEQGRFAREGFDWVYFDRYDNFNNGAQHTLISNFFTYEIKENGEVFVLSFEGTPIYGYGGEGVELRFYVCVKDNVASVLTDEISSFENDLSQGYWKEIVLDTSKTKQAVDVSDYDYDFSGNYLHLTDYIGGSVYVILPQPTTIIDVGTVADLRYVGIKSIDNRDVNKEPDKWLFDIDDVNLTYGDNVSYNNASGFYYPLWESNHEYHNGDVVRYNYSNFKCVAESGEGNFTRDYGDFKDVKITWSINESKNDMVNAGTIHTTKGVLPFIIRNNSSEIEIFYDSFEKINKPELNSCAYDTPTNKWLCTELTLGDGFLVWNDSNNRMIQVISTIGSSLREWPTTSDYSDYIGEITDDNNVLKIYKEGDLFYTLSELDEEPTSHISGTSHIELHNSNIWKKLNESGFDYHFTFERNLLERTDSGDFYEEDYQFTHNFADHTLKLVFYDDTGKELEVLNNNTSKYFEKHEWQPETTYFVGEYVKYEGNTYIVQYTFSSEETFNANNMKLVNSIEWRESTKFFDYQYISYNNDVYQVIPENIDNLDGYISSTSIEEDIANGHLNKIPTQYIQLGTTGELLVTVNYAKGN